MTVNDCPQVQAARAKRDSLKAELAAAQRALAERTSASTTDKRSSLDAAVDRVLEGGQADITAPPSQAELIQRVNVLSATVERASRIVADAEHAASLKIGEAAQAEYGRQLRPIAAAVRPLIPLLKAELAFRRNLVEGGVSASALKTLPLAGRIDPNEPAYVFEKWLADYEQFAA